MLWKQRYACVVHMRCCVRYVLVLLLAAFLQCQPTSSRVFLLQASDSNSMVFVMLWQPSHAPVAAAALPLQSCRAPSSRSRRRQIRLCKRRRSSCSQKCETSRHASRRVSGGNDSFIGSCKHVSPACITAALVVWQLCRPASNAADFAVLQAMLLPWLSCKHT